jgi:hypothetical protein
VTKAATAAHKKQPKVSTVTHTITNIANTSVVMVFMLKIAKQLCMHSCHSCWAAANNTNTQGSSS